MSTLEKARLLETMQHSYETFNALLAPLSEAEMSQAQICGDWSIKDVLGHLTAWMEYLLERLRAARSDRTPERLYQNLSEEEIEQLNRAFAEERKAWPLRQILDDFHSSYDAVYNAVAQLDEELLSDPGRLSWEQRWPLWQSVASDTYEHFDEHASGIRAWLSTRA
jgi:hypothetical protein